MANLRGEDLQAKYGATKRTRTEKTYNCIKCGQVKADSSFYESPASKIWLLSKNKVLLCKNCVTEIFEEYKLKYGVKLAVIVCCALLDVPYSDSAFNSITDKENISFGNYMVKIKVGVYKSQSFANSFINNELVPQSNIITKNASIEDNGDNRNKKFVLSVVGYDPFEDTTLSEIDKKKAYNMLASYCELPNVEDNSHTIQSVIQIVEQQIQVEILNNRINHLLVAGSTSDDDKMLQGYITSRKNIQDCIVKMAESSNIAASKNSGANTNKNTLAVKMKEMLDDQVEEAQPNLFNIKWCDAAKQIADISNKSILEQLDLQDNDYADMVKKQREIITKQEEQIDVLEEENRNLKNQLLRMGE